MKEAFKPLGVYIHFWQAKLEAGGKRTFRIMMVNDAQQRMSGKLKLTLEPTSGGKQAAGAETAFDVPALGQANYDIELVAPQIRGEFLLKAAAESGAPGSPTISRRKVTIEAASR
jgi:hypothetical protein